jgi:hypothetical protein
MKINHYFLCITALCCGAANADGEITRMLSQLGLQLDALMSQGEPSVFDHFSDSPVVRQQEETTQTLGETRGGPMIIKKHSVTFDPSTNTKREVITTESVLNGEGGVPHTIEKSKTVSMGQERHTHTKNDKKKDHQNDLSQKEVGKRRQWKRVKHDPLNIRGSETVPQGGGEMASLMRTLVDSEMRHWPDMDTVSFVSPMDAVCVLDSFVRM